MGMGNSTEVSTVVSRMLLRLMVAGVVFLLAEVGEAQTYIAYVKVVFEVSFRDFESGGGVEVDLSRIFVNNIDVLSSGYRETYLGSYSLSSTQHRALIRTASIGEVVIKRRDEPAPDPAPDVGPSLGVHTFCSYASEDPCIDISFDFGYSYHWIGVTLDDTQLPPLGGGPGAPRPGPGPQQCHASTINYDNLSVTEDVPLVGVPFALHFTSSAPASAGVSVCRTWRLAPKSCARL